ncbi:MAG: hypothetical protein R2800_01970 [Flavipsychrobacter sp.]
MSHHEQVFLSAPKFLDINHKKDKIKDFVRLYVKGQGVVTFKLKEQAPFDLTINNPTDDGVEAIKITVTAEKVVFSQCKSGKWEDMSIHGGGSELGIDKDPDCVYWYSIDYHNRYLRYGKGEVRLNTALASQHLQQPTSSKKKDEYAWLNEVRKVVIDHNVIHPLRVWRDPVVIDPPLAVVDRNMIAMDDIALNNCTVPENLTAVCQQLYANVGGQNFQLNTPDFPFFVDAVEASIKSPKGWCYKTLKEKEGEFGPGSDPKENYLRITMGVNQGDSPGIPYVMEIWPPGCYSPIHNHARANAIIRVLSGEINVSLYPMLSKYHEVPFMDINFRKDQVTWISPELNQTHKLRNPNESGPTCITIQCYTYAKGNMEHYEYFDFLDEEGDIQQFTPNSDCGFLEFKAIMKKEWEDGTTR